MDEAITDNMIVASDDLPISEDTRFEPLSKSYITMNRVVWGGIMLATATINITIRLLNGDGLDWFLQPTIATVFIILFAVLLCLTIIVPRLLWSTQGYQLREQNVHFKHGIVWRAVTSLPYVRVQHVELESGPLERMFRLATLKFYTAGGGSADMKIPGLPFATASKVRAFVLEKAGIDVREDASDG